MEEYQEMSRRLQKATAEGRLQDEIDAIRASGSEKEKQQLDMLLHPENYPPVVRLEDCMCSTDHQAACEVSCLFEAIGRDRDGKLVITGDCVGCGQCVERCEQKALAGRKDLIPLLKLLRERSTPVYAMIAPAFSGQFTAEVTSGRLRTAFKRLGFYGMIEVALFADILTLKEALEFDQTIQSDEDFMLTSCCCPMWVALIKKGFSELIPHVPPSVSPMVACGRTIKKIHPEAKTVFIGPCIAKKAEARQPDVADAVDFVLTFDEVGQMFADAELDLPNLPEDMSDHSSTAGRIYARTGGVSQAVQATLDRLRPDHKIPLRAIQADGIVACKQLLADLKDGKIKANFMEGMGCKGGCVGGPKSLLPKEEATGHVNAYGEQAGYATPADNPYVLEILRRLGFDTIESLLERDNTFIREF
ncbi:[Fe-Fe] hydrogenase large subunit C-terminal domain-containing protein [Ethanoligenens harbinense]|uniref:Hydrogenase large subunit domain protein n=1 Tax=Ethanoligenens harbinense (strain DSM 18485 / JCM 12961 / CGMCC 1.5033 / YUAN-3) TaxID=663278 RepID=E6U5F5_ETHHY|nr:[Fe-Fe] hydrogenase large subunit C-terminal domain-containing protein [Ethanoligenens harbinense]ADU25622.1 hydrogenase large subunit domain protein [Ethanoligenens harbinense YUAN-3]AVQ94799.1 iron hydrogenase [Ethanoligenens harbinense YUAN-3]AYF39953.1 iron hydrogenase [Ethanoligenens harbinense]AYF40209.1 iron hydrogenase [Ethanoligenens harbinense]QCN91045.1 iron hydrogenase [Ethanoligenens harbinense]